MKKFMLLMGLAACLLTSAATAQSAWQGPYIGLGLGGVFDNHEVAGISGLGTSGYAGVLMAGYDFVPSNSSLLIGGWTQGDLTSAITKIGPVELNRQGDWAIGGRIGYIVAPNILLYGTVGYTQAYYHVNITNSGFSAIDGITYGGGAEWQFAKSLFGRLEYRHDDYNPASKFKDTVTDSTVMAVISLKLNGANDWLSSTKDGPVSHSGYTPLK
jgi:outer membrane immunogenic protein